MRYTVASTIALAAAVVASPVAQGVTEEIKPDSSAPSGCSPDYSGEFQIQVTNVTSSEKRDLSKRQQADATKLEITLKAGVLKDSQDRTGYIAANNQFQFDGPPQTGAIYTAGWSACGNGSLALGGSTVFYQCLSGDFYNLYDKAEDKEQCNQVHINIVGGGSGAASQLPDGQPQETPAPVSQISDGQVQASTSGAPVSQIPDGQIQAAPSVSPVAQIPDGQIQAPYNNGTSAAPAPAPSGTGAVSQPAPFEGAASKAYTAGAAAVVALFGLVVAL